MGKTVFIECHGRLTMDMLTGSLLDMGVPFPYLEGELRRAAPEEVPLWGSCSTAQIKAAYFHIPPRPHKELLLKEQELLDRWNELCSKGGKEWKETGWKVISALGDGASEALDIPADIVDFGRCGVVRENVVSLYAFLVCMEYLSADRMYVCPIDLKPAESEKGRSAECMLKRNGTTESHPIAPELIEPFAAAALEGMAADFLPMDSRFLPEKTAYGTDSSTAPGGDNTVAAYIGYFTDRKKSVFDSSVKIFGVEP